MTKKRATNIVPNNRERDAVVSNEMIVLIL